METGSDGFFYLLIYVSTYFVSMVNQSLKKLAHIFPAFLTCPVQNSWKEERNLVEDLILSADQVVDFVVH